MLADDREMDCRSPEREIGGKDARPRSELDCGSRQPTASLKQHRRDREAADGHDQRRRRERVDLRPDGGGTGRDKSEQ